MAAIAAITSYEYAAGTCTLRLVGELSPLSQVTGQPVLARSRFHLQLREHDPLPPAPPAADPGLVFEASGREPQFSALANLVHTYVQRQLNAPALAAGGAVTQNGYALQPVGLSRHRLTLAMAPEPPRPAPARTVELSTLQLSDLAEALEQADSSLQILPEVATPQARRARPRLPIWLGSVAAVGIAALLGNQLLTTTPPAVVLSPSESASQTPSTDRSTAQGPAASQPLTQDQLPAAADTAESTAGEALPAPITTAPTTPSAAPPADVGTSTPKVSPGAGPAPTPQLPAPTQQSPVAPSAPSPPARARAQADPTNPPSAADSPPPAATGPDALSAAPASPEVFAAESGRTAASAPDTALAWLSNLTQALQQRWRPPANLAAPLRYSLTLGADGTVVDLAPLNDFSATYQATPTLPQVGTTILGVDQNGPTTVEVRFLPSGEVVVVPPGEINSD